MSAARAVADVLRESARHLSGSSASSSLDARLIVAHVLQREPAWLIAHRDEAVPAAALATIAALTARRAVGAPLAYVLGEAWFFGRRFEVTPDVLVPRPETEHLVEAALSELRARSARATKPLRVCDVGTGSGAIALSLAAEHPNIEVVASDTSAAALEVARRNALRLHLAERVRFVCGDLAEPLRPLGPFDCVVANLPYVPSAQVPEAPDPVGFEPRVAIDGGIDGLGLYRRLLRALPALASPGASAYFEAAPGTIAGLADAAANALPQAHVEIGEDYAGLERWVAIALP